MVLIADIGVLWGEYVWPIILLVLGFGMVVFIHELGHFLACKAVGVRVDRFALGFGPRLVGFRKGETDYCIKMLPLGGYVKMLGQEDFDALEDGGEAKRDPRSFLNKPIWARMVIVSAGVVMNIIFAAVLFVVVCSAGIRFYAPVVGDTVPGFPAAEATTSLDPAATGPTSKPASTQATQPAGAAGLIPVDEDALHGLQPGDTILTVDGEDVSRFMQVRLAAALADRDETVVVTFRRDGKIGTCTLSVKMSPMGMLAFGIAPAKCLVVGKPRDLHLKTPFKPKDRVIAIEAIGRREVKHHWKIASIEEELDGTKEVIVIVKREDKDGQIEEVPIPVAPQPYLKKTQVLFNKKDGSFFRYRKVKWVDKGESLEVTLADGSAETVKTAEVVFGGSNILDVLGLIPRLRVDGVVDGSSADKAGLKPGDIIVSYGDKRMPTLAEVHEVNEQFVDVGTDMVVEREGKAIDPMDVVPKKRGGAYVIGIRPGIDVANLKVGAVRLGSPAAAAGLMRGDVITEFNGAAVKTWIDIVALRRKVTKGTITIGYTRGGDPCPSATVDVSAAALLPRHYGFHIFSNRAEFEDLKGPEVKKTNPLAATAWGLTQTWDMLKMQYASLRSIINRNVPFGEMRGPVGISEMGIEIGRKGIVEMIYFMAMISVCLAVFNFLPLPLVDGGLAVMLIIEKVRGKPMSVKLTNIIQLTGLAMILCLFIAVTWNDIARIVRDLW